MIVEDSSKVTRIISVVLERDRVAVSATRV